MFKELCTKWLSLEQNKNADDVDSTTAAVVMDFANWLDTQRSRTPHETDTEHTCPVCEGRGMRAYKGERGLWHCYACNGTGQV